jgi:predicted nucleic-acid-binding Zn-ribbon protein
MKSRECPDCGGRNLYRSEISAGGGHAPNYLQGLGGFFLAPKFEVVVCQDCGLTRFYAPDEARRKLSESKKWTRTM